MPIGRLPYGVLESVLLTLLYLPTSEIFVSLNKLFKFLPKITLFMLNFVNFIKVLLDYK